MLDLEARLRAALADRYRVEREIGRGGMAHVFLADDLRHHRQVAIKILLPEIADAVGPGRFLREIEVTAQLAHPSILPVYDSGEVAGTFFYVMPFVPGESLKDRLAREKQLPLDEALTIALAVADALAHAHSYGIVHRDIKPANILVEAGHAVVADFGIAKALTDAGGERLTATGVAVGTPGYMSPEQASGAGDIDQRSDLYSLGCVLYEMLAGETPFTGPSAQAVMAKQLSSPVPDLRIVRETVPPAVAEVVERCLAKVPADRFQTAADFAAALDVAKGQRASRARRRRPRTRVLMAGGALTVLATAAAVALSREFSGRPGVPRDTTRYAIVPFAYDEPAPALNEVERLQDALGRWNGITIALDAADPGVGREIRGSVSHVDDNLRVHAALYDAPGDRALAEHTVRVPPDMDGADSLMASLADHLVLRGSPMDEWGNPFGTRSLPALQAFDQGRKALENWNLAAAETAFVAAATFDQGFARAQLWTALVRLWSGAERARWSIAAEQAVLGASTLGARDRALAEAVVRQARADLPGARARWERAVEQWPNDYAAWYGLARCLVADARVVPDRGSPSGWSFRTSYHQALDAFERAFERHPAILASFRGRSYEDLRMAFMVGNEVRGGLGGSGDTVLFTGEPAWRGDTLALVPYPVGDGTPRPPPESMNAARQHQRERFRNVALAWVTTHPTSSAAMEALAIGLGMLGDPAARDTLAHARRLATEPIERFRVAGAEVWMRLAFAVPWDESGVRHARALADSLLSGEVASAEPDPVVLPGLAALLGYAERAAAFARAPAVADAMLVPPVLRETAPALLVYAAMGGPADSVRGLAERVGRIIDESLLPSERVRARLQWIARAATLAFSVLLLPGAEALEGQGDQLLDMQLAWQRGDTVAVRRAFAELRSMREALAPGSVTLDALYPEAALLLKLGEVKEAAAWLDQTLLSLYLVAPHELGSPVRAASLLPALMLRTTIAERLADSAGADRWSLVLRVLRSDAGASSESHRSN